MGVVYEAEQISLGRRVALKILPRHSPLGSGRLERFQREAQAAARLHHTNIVPLMGIGDAEGIHFIVMQFIDGRGLDAVIREWNPPDDAEATALTPSALRERLRCVARIGVQAAEAIQYAHDQGILHRDIKPANILIDQHRDAWITDFGLAKLAQGDNLTKTGDIVGTLAYMAPERFHSAGDARSDVYSLGLTLYELLTLEAAFHDQDPSRLIQRICEGQAPPPRSLNPSIPADLETIVLKAIAREPEHRYATAGAVAEDLKRFLDDRPILARRASVFEQAVRWCRRNRAVAALAATAAASLLAAAVIGWVGYVTTTNALSRESIKRVEAEKATQRAEDNVQLSIGAILSLLGRIAPEVGGAGGGASAERERQVRMARGFGFPPPPPGNRPGPRFEGRGEPPPPPERGGPGGPRGSQHDWVKELELLQTILTFYDNFAAKTPPDGTLRFEAAKAFRHVGELHDRLGHSELAGPAYERAVALFESLVDEHAPGGPDCRFELADVYASAAARSTSDDPKVLGRLESELRRAEDLAAALRREKPEAHERTGLLARVLREHGRVFDRLHQPPRAEGALRSAVMLLEPMVMEPSAGQLEWLALGDSRLTLAEFLTVQKRRGEPRTLIQAAAKDFLNAAAAHDRRLPPPLLIDRFERTGQALRDAGDTRLADELSGAADHLRRPPELGPPGDGFPPPGGLGEPPAP
jgi:predicted Ser/Thr protein kinase/tetratricopeptide (TPR) repeat protein